MADKTITLDVTIKHETENALLIDHEDLDESVWIPLSQISYISRRSKDTDTVTMTEWVARKVGLCE